MANHSKGDRKLVGMRIPLDLIQAVKEEAQRKELCLNDYFVRIIWLGLKYDQEPARIPAQISPRIA